MKKYLLLAGVACFCASNAFAADVSPYVAAKMKYLFMKNDAKVTFQDATYIYQAKWDVDDEILGGSMAVGMSVPLEKIKFRTELEYNLNADAKKSYYGLESKVKTQAILLNGYLEFASPVAVKPYISAGLGGARLKGSVENESISKTKFAWQVGLGAAYDISQHVAIDGGYRFVDYGKINKNTTTEDGYPENDKVESKAHELYMGVRYSF